MAQAKSIRLRLLQDHRVNRVEAAGSEAMPGVCHDDDRQVGSDLAK